MALNLSDLVSQYPVLATLARYVSTVDLFNLARTCRDYHAHILESPRVFDGLKKGCLCDGQGLRHRVVKLMNTRYFSYGHQGRNNDEEEIEVRLFATKCDEAGALPCRSCGINVCEECRECPRLMPVPWNTFGMCRPQLSHDLTNVMCLCEPCDSELERELKGQFLDTFCDCNQFKRWICRKCKRKESNEAYDYFEKRTVFEPDFSDDDETGPPRTKVLRDAGFDRAFWCMCGASVPESMMHRCYRCKRRIPPLSKIKEEEQEIKAQIPGYVDNDGCYPLWSQAYDHDLDWVGYPKLRYTGPIYQGPYRDALSPRRLPIERRQGPATLRAWQQGFR